MSIQVEETSLRPRDDPPTPNIPGQTALSNTPFRPQTVVMLDKSSDTSTLASGIDTTIASALKDESATNKPDSAETKKHQPDWTCRLPTELMSLVIEDLTADKAIGTLASLQQTSRSIYTLVTPYMYKDLYLQHHQANKLFGLFDSFPRKENRFFFQTVPTNIHPLDMHICQRIRYFFSGTQTLSLKLGYGDLYIDNPDHFVERYKEVVNALIALDEPRLWSSIEKCVLDLGSWVKTRQQLDIPFGDKGISRLFEAVFHGMVPNHMSIILPPLTRTMTYGPLSSLWERKLETLRAKHLEINSYLSPLESLPHATTSLRINLIDVSALSLRDQYHEDQVEETISSLFRDYETFHDNSHLKVVGTFQWTYTALSTRITSAAETLDMLDDHLNHVMLSRIQKQNTEDLKVTIQANVIPEGSAAAVSRIYKQPVAE